MAGEGCGSDICVQPGTNHQALLQHLDRFLGDNEGQHCTDKCSSDGAACGYMSCTTLVQTYACSDYYAPDKQWSGWCDKTCGYCAVKPKTGADWLAQFTVNDY